MTSHQTFRGYVTIMNNKYARFEGGNFMSVNTFINWFFAWASRMRIDFRRGCQQCGGVSKVLACDGTKLGTQFANTFVSPIEIATCEVPDTFTQTKRHDRCFLYNPIDDDVTKRIYAKHRTDLQTVSHNILISKENVQSVIDSVRPAIPLHCQAAFDVMITHKERQVQKSFAGIFKLLGYSSSVDSIFPVTFCKRFRSEPQPDFNFSRLSQESLYFSHELSFFLKSVTSETSDAAVSLFCYCVDFVLICHADDIPPAPAVKVPGTYNPAKYGRAYYFTDHGQQIRQMRRFPIDKKMKQGQIYDDAPDIRCEKLFPQVSKKGTSYLFLWFCPQHGHCYGYHVIPESEGCKDAASSLYLFMEKAPEIIMYDFACSLSEYVKNREAGFFQDTKFYHDYFHGFTHKCSKSFRCDKLLGFSQINSSICEQFNAFIKKIKKSSKLMTQSHFNFYLQFFIEIWNKMKERNLKKKSLGARECRQ